MRVRGAVVVGSFLLVAACVAPTNPFDPETPPESQQPGSLQGTVFALRGTVVDDEGKTIDAAGPCALGSVDGDHAGFVVVLQRLLANGTVIETPATNASGRFAINNLVPGTYVLSVLSDTFATPPPEQVEIGVGEAVTRTLCALDVTPPDAPIIDALPAQVADVDVDVALTILNPEPGATYTVTARALGAADETHGATAEDEAPLSVNLALATAQGQRLAWTIAVIATDVLGNESVPAVVSVVRDGLPPAPPNNVRATAARDRVFVAFDPPPLVGGDDPPARYFVSYAVTPRPVDVADACPQGRPDEFGTPDGAFFAVEGASPIETTTTALTLSGLLPGTDLFLYVAAGDAVGNVGCYADAVRVRADEVTFSLLSDTGPGLENAAAIVALPGSTLGALPGGYDDGAVPGVPDGAEHRKRGLYAVASGERTIVVDLQGVAHDVRNAGDGGPGSAVAARDVAVAGDLLVVAGGPLGVGTVPLDAAGAPTDVVVFEGLGDVRAVAGEPGLVFAAAATGLFANGTRVATGDFSDVALTGSRVVAVRRVGAGAEVVVLAREDGFAVIDTAALVETPTATAVVGGSLVVVDAGGGGGVAAYDLAACLPQQQPGSCIVERPRRSIAFDGGPLSVGALDDVALVGTASGDVIAFALPSLRVVGRVSLPSAVGAVVPDELGFCAAIDAVGAAGTGTPARLACASTTAFPVVDGEERAPTSSPALDVVVVDGHVVASQKQPAANDGVGRVAIAPLSALDEVRNVIIGPAGSEAADIAAVGGTALVLRDDGVVVSVRAGADAGTVVVDLAAAAPELAADLGAPRWQGRIAATGTTALVALAGPPPSFPQARVPGRLVRLALQSANDGSIVADVVDILELPGLRRPTSLGIHGSTAWLGTDPQGLLRFSLGASTTLDVDASVPPEVNDTSPISFSTGLVLLGSSPEPVVVTGVGTIGRFIDRTFIGVEAALPSGVNDLQRAGRFVAVTTLYGGAFVVEPAEAGGRLATVLSVPSLASAAELVVTARALMFADDDGGVLRVQLR
jgi:hypothetical protein